MQVYNCKNCDKKLKRLRGCIRPYKRKVIWTIDECIFCEGKNKHCPYCKGKGKIPVHQCPQMVARNPYLLPYFNAYRNSNYLAWPDGRGRLYQPKKLIQAFDVLNYYYNKLEEKKVAENGSKAKSRINLTK